MRMRFVAPLFLFVIARPAPRAAATSRMRGMASNSNMVASSAPRASSQ